MPPADAPTKDSRWKIAAMVMAIVILALAALLYSSNRRQAAPDDETLRQLVERMDAFEQQGASSGQMDSPGFRGPAMTGPTGAANRGLQGGEAGGMTDQQAAARDELLRRQLEAGFARQASDPAAPRLEIDMLGAMNDKMLANANVTPKNPDVVCKRETCRITASFRSQAEASDWAVLYMTTVGAEHIGNAKPTFTRNPDGSMRMSLYADRARP